MSNSFALSFFGIAVLAIAVLTAFSVRPRWRLVGLLLAAAIFAAGAGLRGEFPGPASFELRFVCLVIAGMLALFGKRFAYLFPAVLLLWFLGAWGNSAFLSIGDVVRGLHRLLVVACAGIGVAAFSRLLALAWNAESLGPPDAEPQSQSAGSGWRAVSIATGLLLVALFLTLVYELTYRAEPLGLQPPLGLLATLAEAVAGICLWRATVQTSQLEPSQSALRHGTEAAGWKTVVGLMVVFVLTGLAFTMIPILVATDGQNHARVLRIGNSTGAALWFEVIYGCGTKTS